MFAASASSMLNLRCSQGKGKRICRKSCCGLLTHPLAVCDVDAFTYSSHKLFAGHVLPASSSSKKSEPLASIGLVGS